MEILQIIIITLLATTAMTLFSYFVSWTFDKNYKEPVLLEFLMVAFKFEIPKQFKVIISWILHYCIGLLFVVLFYLPIWLQLKIYNVNIISGLLFGCIIGFIGIMAWQFMFAISPKRPPTNRKGFLLQLFFAHIIFGLTAVLADGIISL
ncbi:hypothetical protein ACRASX_15775 [Flavobacterium sp. TMP13]|uniref:hypothetical protein n=1 Tax=Flavobacterium sp. TMP13 TaxID=3425950 RepID=UPI003D76B21D